MYYKYSVRFINHISAQNETHTTKDLFSALFVKFIIAFFRDESLPLCLRLALLPYFDLAKCHAFKSFGHDTFSLAAGSSTLGIYNSNEFTFCYCKVLLRLREESKKSARQQFKDVNRLMSMK